MIFVWKERLELSNAQIVTIHLHALTMLYQSMMRIPVSLLPCISGRRLADRSIKASQEPLLSSTYFFSQVDYNIHQNNQPFVYLLPQPTL